jgi:hypothetical protein
MPRPSTAGEVTRRADAEITREMNSLEAVYRRGGAVALNQALIERAGGDRPFLYLLLDKDGKRMTGSIAESPVDDAGAGETWASFSVTDIDMDGGEIKRPARGLQERLDGGEVLFVGADVGESRGFVSGIVNALWGAGAGLFELSIGQAAAFIASALAPFGPASAWASAIAKASPETRALPLMVPTSVCTEPSASADMPARASACARAFTDFPSFTVSVKVLVVACTSAFARPFALKCSSPVSPDQFASSFTPASSR